MLAGKRVTNFWLRERFGAKFWTFEKSSLGTVTIIVVPWPAAVRISNLLSISYALARILPNPKPSFFSNRAAEMPDPLSLIWRTRFGGSHRRVTTIRLGLAWRIALWIASWAMRK